MNLKGKTIVLGITGGIAAYKMPNVAHALAKAGANVHVLMTKNATEFITPLVFETLTNNRCIVDTFDRNFQYDVAHVSLANAADLMLIAPATANVIAKLAHGLADDMLTTVTLAARCPKLVAPAMNTHMLENPITQDNLKTLEHYGFTVIPSGSGLLACGDTGSGRLPDEGVLVDYVARELEHEKDMQGMKVVVSAGGTREPMDPVRYLTNHSTGKMGYAVARACMLRGADVTLLTSSDLPPVPFVKMVPFATAAELFEAVKANAMDADALVMAAAVADYRPAQVAQDKIKKHDGELSIELERTDDILGWVGEHKPEQLFVCGFSMETKDLIENSTAKLHKKNMDMIKYMHERGHVIGLHFALNGLTDMELVRKKILQEIHVLSEMIGVEITEFSIHRPSADVLRENIKFPGIINAYQDEFFTFSENVMESTPLHVKYISDAKHRWNYGTPDAGTLLENDRVQILTHPYSWTKKGYDNLENFRTLIQERNEELMDTIDNECKHFASVRDLL